MKRLLFEDYAGTFHDDDACLEWLKNQLHPQGIECKICKKITRHHKLSKRPCYICDNCGNHFYPAAGTIFHKSTTPLKTWFEVINRMYDTKGSLTPKEIQRKYGLSYKTSLRMVKRIREYLDLNSSRLAIKGKTDDNRPCHGTDFCGARIKFPLSHSVAADVTENPTLAISKLNILSHLNTKGSKPKRDMRDYSEKSDRIARLLKIQLILWQYPKGLEIMDIAQKCCVNKRTIYRDLEALESKLGVPIWEEGKKRGISQGYFLPPVIFNKPEAMNIFLAVRLMQNFSRLYNPSMASTFIKLNTIVPPLLRKQIQNTLEYMDKLPRNDEKIENFNKLTEAWLSQHRIKIQYRELGSGSIEEYILEPYFIEPAMPSRSSYVIAFCPLKNSIYTFKIDLIVGNVIIQTDSYEIPSDFNAVDYFGTSWGIFTNEELEMVKLKFNKRMSKGIMETVWHPSQKTELQEDESLIMTLRVRNTIDFRAWILGWSDNVEVLEPHTLKDQIKDMAKSIVNTYSP